eukprot:scaffold3350_cov78-Skeletonema_dohrnii-CCMP3373.AAC.1
MFVVHRRGISHMLVQDATEVLALGAGRKTPHGLICSSFPFKRGKSHLSVLPITKPLPSKV